MPRYEPSRFCYVFPDMDADQYEHFKESIKEFGVKNAVTLWNDPEKNELVIIDGRHRWRACEELGIECPTKIFDGDENDVAKFIRIENFERRQMNYGQIAAAFLKLRGITNIYRNQGREKLTGRPVGAKTGSGDTSCKMTTTAYGAMAKEAGVSPATINRAARVEREDPELLDKIISGEKTLHEAHKEVKARQDARKPQPTEIESRDLISETDEETDEEAEAVEQPTPPPAPKSRRQVDPDREPTPYEKMQDWNAVVEDWAKAAIEVGNNPPDGIDQKTLEIINGHLRSAASTIRAQKGHAICSYCDGAGCVKCNQLGWLNKTKHESAPPRKRGAA